MDILIPEHSRHTTDETNLPISIDEARSVLRLGTNKSRDSQVQSIMLSAAEQIEFTLGRKIRSGGRSDFYPEFNRKLQLSEPPDSTDAIAITWLPSGDEITETFTLDMSSDQTVLVFDREPADLVENLDYVNPLQVEYTTSVETIDGSGVESINLAFRELIVAYFTYGEGGEMARLAKARAKELLAPYTRKFGVL